MLISMFTYFALRYKKKKMHFAFMLHEKNSEKATVEYNHATTPICVAVWKLASELKSKD